MQRRSIYEVEPVVKEIHAEDLSHEGLAGLDLILDQLKQTGEHTYSHGGGLGGFIGIDKAVETRLSPVVEDDDACAREYCSLELQCDGLSQGRARDVSIELRCNGARLSDKKEAEALDVTREACSQRQAEVLQQLDARLGEVPDRVHLAAGALQDASAQQARAQEALRAAYNL